MSGPLRDQVGAETVRRKLREQRVSVSARVFRLVISFRRLGVVRQTPSLVRQSDATVVRLGQDVDEPLEEFGRRLGNPRRLLAVTEVLGQFDGRPAVVRQQSVANVLLDAGITET